MLAKLALLALAALTLAGCGTVNCGGSGDNDRAGGGCRAHTTC